MKKFTIVAVIHDRTLKVVSDGTEDGTTFNGDAHDILVAKSAIRHGLNVPFGSERNHPSAIAGYETPLSLAAALYAVSPPYVYLWKAPSEVLEFIDSFKENQESISIIIEDK